MFRRYLSHHAANSSRVPVLITQWNYGVWPTKTSGFSVALLCPMQISVGLSAGSIRIIAWLCCSNNKVSSKRICRPTASQRLKNRHVLPLRKFKTCWERWDRGKGVWVAPKLFNFSILSIDSIRQDHICTPICRLSRTTSHFIKKIRSSRIKPSQMAKMNHKSVQFNLSLQVRAQTISNSMFCSSVLNCTCQYLRRTSKP